MFANWNYRCHAAIEVTEKSYAYCEQYGHEIVALGHRLAGVFCEECNGMSMCS